MKHAVPVALLLLALAGCTAVGPEMQTPTTPEATQLFASDEGIEVDSLANWWRQFNDPVLTTLIEQGLAASPTVDAALARLRAARAEREGSEADFYPKFTASGAYVWERAWGNTQSNGWNRRLSASVDASWEIDIFGGLRRSLEQAAAREARLAYSLQDVRVSLAAEIASTILGMQNGRTDVACIYDMRMSHPSYAALFDVKQALPHQTYYAFVAFNALYKLGTQAECTCDTDGVYAVAATNGKKHALMISNISGATHALTIEGVDLSEARFAYIDDRRMLSWAPDARELKNNSIVLIEW